MKNGVPQGGGLSPILWRSSTNDLPEAGLRSLNRRIQRGQENVEVQPLRPGSNESVISRKIDNIREDKLTTEEHLDKQLRSNGKWKLKEWKNERTGVENQINDKLLYRKEKDDKDVVTTIYADDTQSRASARSWSREMGRG